MYADHIPASLVAIGFAATLLLLAVALLAGLHIRRQVCSRRTESLDEYHLGKLMQGLFHWTDDFASDVSRYRQVVDSLKRQVKAAEAQSPQADPAAVVRLLSRIVQTNDLLQQRLDNAELTLKEQAAEITSYMSEARTDTLTGLPNRRVFDEELSRRMAEYRRHGTPVSVILVDIDLFKQFNDRYGHLAGDAVLVHVGRVMRDTMRESDLVARLGGEEFSILLPGPRASEAPLAAERLRVALEQSVCEYEGQQLQVTASCGAAQAAEGEDSRGMVHRADLALYASKANGRNCSHWHDGQETVSLTRAPSAPVATAAETVTSAGRERRKAEFAQVCDELRRRLIDVVGQQA
jgi:diguanylate cyclase